MIESYWSDDMLPTMGESYWSDDMLPTMGEYLEHMNVKYGDIFKRIKEDYVMVK